MPIFEEVIEEGSSESLSGKDSLDKLSLERFNNFQNQEDII